MVSAELLILTPYFWFAIEFFLFFLSFKTVAIFWIEINNCSSQALANEQKTAPPFSYLTGRAGIVD
jgi:uncharacterized membrane protein